MKNVVLAFLSFAAVMTEPAIAQDSQNQSEPIDEVIATGTLQRDKAMAAYLSGDYVTAEIEFERNAFCALRATRNFRAGVEAAGDSTIRADVGVDANVPAQPTGGAGGVSGGGLTPQVAAPIARINGSNFNKNESIAPRTCADRGYQLYMAGLSQLKLGKFEESKESFERAVVLRKSIYDAYFRLSLLEYQGGNLRTANKHFQRLKALQKKCRKCESKKEIAEQVQYLQKILG